MQNFSFMLQRFLCMRRFLWLPYFLSVMDSCLIFEETNRCRRQDSIHLSLIYISPALGGGKLLRMEPLKPLQHCDFMVQTVFPSRE